MKVTLSKKSDMAYIYLTDIKHGEASTTYTCDPGMVHGMINLDFDKGGFLIGIEIADASKKLPKTLLEQATMLD